MKVGNLVEVKTFVISGKVIDTQYNKIEECLEHLVEYEGEDGEKAQRWYKESELKVTKG